MSFEGKLEHALSSQQPDQEKIDTNILNDINSRGDSATEYDQKSKLAELLVKAKQQVGGDAYRGRIWTLHHDSRSPSVFNAPYSIRYLLTWNIHQRQWNTGQIDSMFTVSSILLDTCNYIALEMAWSGKIEFLASQVKYGNLGDFGSHIVKHDGYVNDSDPFHDTFAQQYSMYNYLDRDQWEVNSANLEEAMIYHVLNPRLGTIPKSPFLKAEKL